MTRIVGQQMWLTDADRQKAWERKKPLDAQKPVASSCHEWIYPFGSFPRQCRLCGLREDDPHVAPQHMRQNCSGQWHAGS